MTHRRLFKSFAPVILLALCTTASAVPIVVNPSDDGRVTPTYVVRTDYVIAGDGETFGRGIIEFSTAGFLGHVESALLSVTAYGLPAWSPTIHVYGYESTDGRVALNDYSKGASLGEWTLGDMEYGKDVFFDVSAFLAGVRTPFAGFVLQGLFNPVIGSTGYDVLSSLEQNYGHPAQLIVTTTTTVPESDPLPLALLASAGMLLGAYRRLRAQKAME